MADEENIVLEQEVVPQQEIVETPPVETKPEVDAAELQARLAEMEARYREASQKSAQFDELINKWEQEQLDAVTQQFSEAGVPDGEGGFKPLDEQTRSQVATLIRDGYTYRQMAPRIQEQNVLAEALIAAWKVVGDDGKTSDLRALMTEMAQLGDPRLMARHADYLKQRSQNTVREQRSQIDRVPASPAAPVQMSSVEEIQAKIASPGGLARLTSDERRIYNDYRKSQGLPTVAGWS